MRPGHGRSLGGHHITQHGVTVFIGLLDFDIDTAINEHHLTSLQVGLVRPLVVAAPGLAVGAVPVDQHHQRHQEQQVGDQQRVGDVDDLHSHSLLVTVSSWRR